MKIKLLILAVILVVVPILPHTEINQRLIIQALAVDFEDGEFRITIVYPLVEGEFDKTSVTDEDLFTALLKLEDNLGKEIIMTECQSLVFGNMGKDIKICETIKKITSLYEFYPKIAVCAAVGEGAELIEITKGSGGEAENQVRQITDLLFKRGSSPKTTIRDMLLRITDTAQDIYLPVFQTYKDDEEEDRIHFCGGAIYREGVFDSEIDTQQALATSIIYGTANNFYIPYMDGEVAKITNISYKINVSESENGSLKIKYQIKAQANYAGDEVALDRIRGKDGSYECEKSLEESITEHFAVTTALAKARGIDFIELSPRVRNKNPKLYRKYAENWQDTLKNAEFEFEAQAEFNAFSVRW